MSIISKILGQKAPEEADPKVPEKPEEHRASDRAGTYKVVSVAYPSGYVRKGVVVDLSPTGARVRFSQRGELPPVVELRITGISGVKKASVVWQENHDAGLKFVE